jgi:hypothetical protein
VTFAYALDIAKQACCTTDVVGIIVAEHENARRAVHERRRGSIVRA